MRDFDGGFKLSLRQQLVRETGKDHAEIDIFFRGGKFPRPALERFATGGVSNGRGGSDVFAREILDPSQRAVSPASLRPERIGAYLRRGVGGDAVEDMLQTVLACFANFRRTRFGIVVEDEVGS